MPFMLFTLTGFFFNCGQGHSQMPAVAASDTIRCYIADDTLTSLSWDTVNSGETVIRYFLLTNNTQQTIRISKIITGDGGCYSESNSGGSISSEPVQPGGIYSFRIIQQTKARSGALSHSVIILYDDGSGETRQKSFRFSGTVLK